MRAGAAAAEEARKKAQREQEAEEERLLLAQDYADQQAADRVTFEAPQKARIENSLATHTQALASKKRLGRVQDEYKAHRTTLLTARSEEYQRLNASAEKKLEEEKEKEKKRKAYGAQKEAKIRLREEAEAAERRAERLRAEAGAYPLVPLYIRDAHVQMAERCEEEEAEVVRKRREEERLAEERAAAAEQARKKAQREQEAEEHARLRAQAAKTVASTTVPESGAWRRPSAQTSSAPAPHAQCPAPTPVSATGPRKIEVALGGWRRRLPEKEKQEAPGTPTSATSSPVMANSPLPEVKKDTDWFETVPAKGVWRPNRLRGKV